MIEKFINYTCLVKSLDTRQIYFYLKAKLSNHHTHENT